MRRRRGIDGHAADGIDSGCRLGGLLKTHAIPGLLIAGTVAPTVSWRWDGFDKYTLRGYSCKMKAKTQTACRSRLNRIEGQVRGINRMIEDNRYCIDVLTQIQAVRAALRKVEDEILRDHVQHCVHGAIESGNRDAQFEKVDELLRVLEKRTP